MFENLEALTDQNREMARLHRNHVAEKIGISFSRAWNGCTAGCIEVIMVELSRC